MTKLVFINDYLSIQKLIGISDLIQQKFMLILNVNKRKKAIRDKSDGLYIVLNFILVCCYSNYNRTKITTNSSL